MKIMEEVEGLLEVLVGTHLYEGFGWLNEYEHRVLSGVMLKARFTQRKPGDKITFSNWLMFAVYCGLVVDNEIDREELDLCIKSVWSLENKSAMLVSGPIWSASCRRGGNGEVMDDSDIEIVPGPIFERVFNDYGELKVLTRERGE